MSWEEEAVSELWMFKYKENETKWRLKSRRWGCRFASSACPVEAHLALKQLKEVSICFNRIYYLAETPMRLLVSG